MSDGDSLAWQHINQRCGNKDCIYCRFRDAEARIAELERIGNIRQEIMEIQEEQIAELNFETELSKEKFADIEDDCRKLRTENARLREAHKSNSHQELKTVEYAERGHRCSYRAAYEAVKQRSQAALLGGGEK